GVQILDGYFNRVAAKNFAELTGTIWANHRSPLKFRTSSIGLTTIARDQVWSQQGEGFLATTTGCTAILHTSAIFVAPAILQVEASLLAQHKPLILLARRGVVTAGGHGQVRVVVTIGIPIRIANILNSLPFGRYLYLDGQITPVRMRYRVTVNGIGIRAGYPDDDILIPAAVGRWLNQETIKHTLQVCAVQRSDDVWVSRCAGACHLPVSILTRRLVNQLPVIGQAELNFGDDFIASAGIGNVDIL